MPCTFCVNDLFSSTCSNCANICHKCNKRVMKHCIEWTLRLLKHGKTLPSTLWWHIYKLQIYIWNYPIFCWHLSESFQCVLLFLQISVWIPQQAFQRQLSLTQRLHSVSSWKLSTQDGWSEVGPGLVLPFFWKMGLINCWQLYKYHRYNMSLIYKTAQPFTHFKTTSDNW